jgi:hypothetical protein
MEHMGQAAKQLGYAESPGYFDAGRFDALPHNELRYACRKAKETSGLQGVYLLRDPDGRNHIPIVFLCEASTEEKAREIHRHVWNLNLVPFVVIETPTRIRVYQGFSYDPDPEKALSLAEASLTDVAEILDQLAAFHAQAIDDGRVFEKWGGKVTPKSRVDEHLLGQLKLLDATLRRMDLPRDPSHCLIGKYVWLSYLKDRRILSDWRLNKAGVQKTDVFSGNAKLTAFYKLDEYLQGWLNGEVFPLHGEDLRAVKSEHLQKVAGIFAGNEANGQMALFTDLYDFSHLPIETLSVVYEQFLHHKEEGDETSEGEESGAYYTPVCLADFMIEEMDRKLRLCDGVAVFDPACGSGAFLVQAYRRLVERTIEKEQRDLKLTELRALLTENIFGVDRDPDACRVARMSLAIALLDYADPPDVSGPTSSFRLPTLSANNILQEDFFSLDPAWPRAKDKQPPQWIIGNPPWVELKTTKRAADQRNKPAWDWFDANKAKYPTSGNQVAEAFVWRVRDFSRPDSVIGLVVPAMTLFKHEARTFRGEVFSRLDVWCVANFANLAYVLFAGRATQPAACLFYHPERRTAKNSGEPIITFAPFVADQSANLPSKPGEQLDTWNILVRSHDWREIDRQEASRGEHLTWKLAMWGSERERRMLSRIQRFPSFQEWAEVYEISFAEAPSLRKGPGKGLTFEKALAGKKRLTFEKLRNAESIFSMSQLPYKLLPEELCYVRERGGRKGFEICEPPHVIVDVGRRFAVYSDEFCIPPAGQIALHGKDPSLLKALAAYLCSSVARWFQFFVSSQWGVAASIARQADLRLLPIPLASMATDRIGQLIATYDELQKCQQRALPNDARSQDLRRSLEEQVLNALELRPQERDLIKGFFDGPWQLIKGKFPAEAVDPAEPTDIREYCLSLRRELDEYLLERNVRHQISAAFDDKQVYLTIEGKRTNRAIEPVINYSGNGQSQALKRIGERLRRKHSQRVYFEKSLYFYERGRMWFLKPRRRIEWNVRQALLDADDLIAELLIGHD